jgi:hypothetical protein
MYKIRRTRTNTTIATKQEQVHEQELEQQQQ